MGEEDEEDEDGGYAGSRWGLHSAGTGTGSGEEA